MIHRIYLDHNATTPLRDEAKAAMIAAMELVGNPSSVHAEGRQSKALIERARAQVAEALGAGSAQVIFTSGATEAAVMVARAHAGGLLASEIEHDCVLTHKTGVAGSVDQNGVLTLDRIERGADTVVAVQAANSETGVLQPIDHLGGQLRSSGLRSLCDASQAFGKIPFAFDWSGFDMALVSAHKLGGPRGVGALVIRSGIEVEPLLRGGGQEKGLRAGTENIVGIAGFGAAAEAASRDLALGVWDAVLELRALLESALEATAPDTIVAGKGASRLPNTINVIAPGWKGETQVMVMDLAGFAVSAGAACSSGKVRASKVLRAMGLSESESSSAIRISLGKQTTRAEIEAFVAAWAAHRTKYRARAA